MTVISVVNDVLGTISKGFVKGLEVFKIKGEVDTIQITALLRSTRILRRVLDELEDLLSLKLQEETIS